MEEERGGLRPCVSEPLVGVCRPAGEGGKVGKWPGACQ